MKTVERHRYKKVNGIYKIFETRSLTFEPFEYSNENIAKIIISIQRNLTPNLLTSKYREENKTNPMYGHCYHSTQAMFYLMNTDKLQPMSGIDYRGDTHWWLDDDGMILDITAEQYFSIGQSPPYKKGKKSKWYGWKERPHQRTLNLMVKVLGNNVKDLVTIPYADRPIDIFDNF